MVARTVRAALTACLVLGACAPATTRPTRTPGEPGPAPGGAPTGGGSPAAEPEVRRDPPARTQGTDETPDDAGDDEGDEDEFADDVESEPPPDATIRPPHPFAEVSDAELERRLVSQAGSLGAMSVGRPNAGRLFNGVQLSDGGAWKVVSPGSAWGTAETLEYLTTAIQRVAAEFPGTSPLPIGDISVKDGGHIHPHVSHQSGRDVDVGYYYRGDGRWYQRASEANLDVARTWAFVRALVTDTDVELILIDRSLQKLLRAEAERRGEDAEWLDAIFRGKGALPPLVRHAPGHATHLHVRFYSPIAQETGRRVYPALVRRHLVTVGPSFIVHVAKKGETLSKLAKRYHTTVRAIRRANGLRTSVIQAKKTYRIPRAGDAPPSVVAGPVAIPPRRLPPAREPTRTARAN